LSNKGYDKELMKECGVADINDNGQYYDFLGKRLIFPISDNSGRVIAFGGRVLENKGFAKYKNTRETELFVKNKVLYNLHALKSIKREKGLDNVIIVEGYMDVVGLNKAGYDNVVASMGTALTKNQARKLKSLSNSIIIAYDGDSAGQNATIKGLEILSEEGLDVRIVTLPVGLDPDETIKERGKEKFEELLNNALPLVDYKLKLLEATFDINTISGKGNYYHYALNILRKIESNAIRQVYIPIISRVIDIGIGTIQKDLENESFDVKINDVDLRITGNAKAKAQKYILNSLLHRCKYCLNDDSISELMIDPLYKEIYGYIVHNKENKSSTVASNLLEIFNEDEDEIIQIASYTRPLSLEAQVKYFNDCINLLKSILLANRKSELVRDYDLATNDNERRQIIQEIRELEREKKLEKLRKVNK